MFLDEKAVGEAQTAEQKNRTLKLSDAIRIGAQIRPQCTGRFWLEGKSCALGAAYEATFGHIPAGGDAGPWNLSQAAQVIQSRAWGELEARYPIPHEINYRIYTMNDQGKTREEIADWVEARGY